MITCDDNYGCGKESEQSFSFSKRDWGLECDEDGYSTIKVCRDCATHMEDDGE